MTTATTVQELASEAYGWFESAERQTPDGADVFYRLKDGRPEWVQDLVREAHGDFLPDDWRYRVIMEACEYLSDTDEPEASEFADQAVDVYNGARLQWLSSNLQRAGYCDDAVDEFGPDGSGVEKGILHLIGLGQFMEAHEVFGSVLKSLEDAVADVEP